MLVISISMYQTLHIICVILFLLSTKYKLHKCNYNTTMWSRVFVYDEGELIVVGIAADWDFCWYSYALYNTTIMYEEIHPKQPPIR